MPRFAPNVLIASASDLHRLIERISLRTLAIDSLDHSIHVVTEIGDKPLSEELRLTLWHYFGVPVFELYTDGFSTLLAYECEAHDGWHIEAGARFAVYHGELLLQKTAESAVRTGLARHLESEPCVCGRPGVRIINPAERLADSSEPLLAATA